MVDPEFRAAIVRGHDDWCIKGLKGGTNPYRYRYAGAWGMGRDKARKGWSADQTYREFKRLGYHKDS